MQMTIFYDFFVYLRYRRLAPGNQYLNYIRIMAKVYGAVTIDGQRCKGCDLCVVACPTDVLLLQPKEVNDRGYHYAFAANPEACIGCAACATVCPDACIEVYRVVDRGE